MSLFLTILIVLAAIILALEIRRRIRKASGRLGRSRNAAPVRTSAGLNLDRHPPRSGGRKKPGRLSHVAGPVVVGLVFIFIGAWLAFSYFMPDAETTAAPLTSAQTLPPPVQTTKALGGRIVLGGRSEAGPSGMSSGASAVLSSEARTPAPTFVADAAKSMINPYSRMDQVGLLLPKAKSQPPAPKPQETQAKAPQPNAAQAQTGAAKAKPQATASAPKTEPAPQGKINAAPSPVVDAASGASSETVRIASSPVRDETVLGGGRDFTVHLSSFRDRDNAENYKNKLVAAGEKAFITETTVNGQQWHRVMSGRFKSRTDAANYGSDLKRRRLTTDAGQYMVKPID